MTEPDTTQAQEAPELVELKNPLKAAGLALIFPGLGHLYQGRTAKAILFMICILPTYFFGWSIGGGKVVYAQWKPNASLFDQRLHYAGQFWVGLPAWPALVQTAFGNPLGEEFMAAPNLHLGEGGEEADWHRQYHRSYEMGTIYTLIAGILNLLVIFDAAGGPIGAAVEDDKKKKNKDPGDKKPSDKDADDDKPNASNPTAADATVSPSA